MLLSRFPRISLAHLPTPLEFLPRLSKYLGGPNIYVKRDDCTGLGIGGNKTRKLEFLIADALEKKATVVITPGAVQSNHVRQTAAAACKVGMKCELVFSKIFENSSDPYLNSGNVFLDKIFGANIREIDKDSDVNIVMEKVVEELREQGEIPYIIPSGGSNPIGALGYVDCALEIIQQANENRLVIDHIIHATGSAGTQAGLISGLKAMSSGIPLLGMGVFAHKSYIEKRVYKLACETVEYMGVPGIVGSNDVVANCDYVGDGYGIPTKEMNDAVIMLARLEGILLDPVYTGKGFAGMIDLIAGNYFDKSGNIVFIHTGGSPGLFAYQDQLNTKTKDF
ncbi:MAG: D-cysteine desulfhydrase [Candidatus Marinimicrobia bacterium]|nr:D-cysteine desulfhydrase [Candidatus Neomarinimicrobiota bacterium]